jgi:hypothetical protein
MKLTIWGNEFVLIAMGVFSSFRRHNSFKDKFTWKFQESLSFFFTEVRDTCRKQFCLFWLPRGILLTDTEPCLRRDLNPQPFGWKSDVRTIRPRRSTLSLDYKRQKKEPNSPEVPTWRNVMFNRASPVAWGSACATSKPLLCNHVFHSSKFGQLCTAVCTNTYCISCIFQIYGFRSLKWCNALCAQLFGFTKRTVSKMDTLQFDVNGM